MAFRAVPTFVIAPRNVSGSSAISGASQVIASGAAMWQATIPALSLRDRASNLLWSALEVMIQGRLTPVLVQACEGLRQPYPDWQRGPYGMLPHSDRSLFSDGAGYYQPVIVAELDQPLARGATGLGIRFTAGAAPEPGQHFSIGERLYRVRSVQQFDVNIWAMGFWPPAREAAPLGAAVEFDRPVCKMRLKDDNAMQMVRDLGRFATPSLEFVEDPT